MLGGWDRTWLVGPAWLCATCAVSNKERLFLKATTAKGNWIENWIVKKKEKEKGFINWWCGFGNWDWVCNENDDVIGFNAGVCWSVRWPTPSLNQLSEWEGSFKAYWVDFIYAIRLAICLCYIKVFGWIHFINILWLDFYPIIWSSFNYFFFFVCLDII